MEDESSLFQVITWHQGLALHSEKPLQKPMMTQCADKYTQGPDSI